MSGRADLHIHSTFSDGALSPEAVLTLARSRNINALSITDHDHTGALPQAVELGRAMDIEVIPGIELSVTVQGWEVHLLGYFIDPSHEELQSFLARIRSDRIRRAERIVQKLNALNLPLRAENVLERAGTAAVGRPHIANALVNEGHVGSYAEAFVRYLTPGKPAYVEKTPVSPREAIRIVAGAGGLTFIAHPGSSLDSEVLLGLIHEGVDGIEVVHPSHTPALVRYYRDLVAHYFLLTSGGSDFHGGRRNDLDALGKYTIPQTALSAMRSALH